MSEHFNTFLDKHWRKWFNRVFCHFPTVFLGGGGQTRGQMLFDLDYEPDLEPSNHVESLRTPFEMILTFRFFFASYVIYIWPQMRAGGSFFL